MRTFNRSGIYTCKCGNSFEKLQSYLGHRSHCVHKGEKRIIKRKKKLCEKCGREVRIYNYEKHFNECKGKPKFENYEKVGKLYKCPYCKKLIKKKGLGFHVWKHTDEGKKFDCSKNLKRADNQCWNKGLTKETDIRVKNNGEKVSRTLARQKRKPLSEKHKQLLSKKMQLAHEKGIAFCIAKTGKPSYPEKIFKDIIHEYFYDKDYKFQFHILSYYLDFAWINKKLNIEIDGSQHQRWSNPERDAIRDSRIKFLGWKILRIKVSDLYDNPTKWIKIAKKFIEGA